MNQVSEKRRYQRCTNAVCKIMMSNDKKSWQEIDVCDISAGGLKFISARDLESENKYYFDISVYNMLSEFTLKFEAALVRKEANCSENTYAAKFINVNKYNQIQLDEVIESRITVSKQSLPAPNYEEGVYTFFFIPRMRTRRIKIY
ncbi:MAG TPA: PilZ domain-containing protein [Pseudobacteroides sp.]|uniref:PilZ domain-containing protein n=1 Tax=Pseudobacteroides sp. TaxID=1968840 RepID=UPI002F95B7FF